jgi:TPR repeat protein
LTTFIERIRSVGEGYSADPLVRGAKHHGRKDYLKALAAWKKASDQGSAEAPYRIGLLYARGEGVLQSLPDACAWYRTAADRGSCDAQFQLGLIYLDGAGNKGPNAPWHARVNSRDEAAAQRMVGLLFPHGLEVQRDPVEAHRLITAAATRGKPEAQALLGTLYERGQGCERDYEKARHWYAEAAEHGIALAQTGLGDIYYQGLGVEADPAVAADWYEKAAKQGDAKAQVAMGSIYLNGRIPIGHDTISMKGRQKAMRGPFTSSPCCI